MRTTNNKKKNANTLNVDRILVPIDFSKTGNLALEHASFMARLFKAELYLLHAVEISDSVWSIYEPSILKDIKDIEDAAAGELQKLAIRVKKEHGVQVKTICVVEKAITAIMRTVKKNKIDLVIMGTHGANGFNEFFVGSNAHKTVTACPCPVITVQTHAKKIGFTNIVLPIDDALHSREKVNHVIALAKKYGSRIHVLGLLDKKGTTDPKKLKIKLDSVTELVKKAGLGCHLHISKADNIARAALNYSKKVKADLIVVLTGHESDLTGMFLGAFAKQVINHSRIPVMSIKPVEGEFEAISLSGSNPF
jgi:nucleotide-binding universal stress UspA family protein